MSQVQSSQVALVVKNLPASAGDMRHGFDYWVGKLPWRRTWQPTPVFLPVEPHGQRILMGYSPWGCEESYTAKTTVCMHIQYYLLRKIWRSGSTSVVQDCLLFYFSRACPWLSPLCAGKAALVPYLSQLGVVRRLEEAPLGARPLTCWV